MASNWLYIDTNFPTFTGEESTEEKVTTIQNYMFMLVEQLRYTLHNLDLSNMNETAVNEFKDVLTDPIYASIADTNGNLAQLAVTATEIATRVSNAEGDISTLQQTAAGISATVTNQAGQIAQLQITAQGLTSRVSTAEGNISTLQQTATSISATVSNQGGQIAALQVTANGIATRVSNAEGNISTLQQTASSMSSTISTQAGQISSLQQTANSISSTVSNQGTAISSLQQTANSLSSTVSAQGGKISTLQQTANSLSTTVSSQGTAISSLQQTANSISSTVSTHTGQISSLQQTASSLSSRITNNAGAISSLSQYVDSLTLSVSNGDSSSTIQLKAGSTVISSKSIYFSGMVTYSDLSNEGWTTINGGNITTGTIKANNVGVSNRFSLYSGGTLYGYMGCGYGYDGQNYTYGAMLSSAYGYYVLATNAGVRMTAGSSSIYVIPNGCRSTKEITVDSDRRVKEDIDYDMTRYEAFFLNLRPCVYHRKGMERRLHTGFIAQDVEAALAAASLRYEDFAALVKDPHTNPEYGIAYGEFAALNTYMIQRLMQRVEALERRTA